MSEDRAPGDAAAAPEMVTLTRDQLNQLLAAKEAEGKLAAAATAAPAVATIAGGSGDSTAAAPAPNDTDPLTITRGELRKMLRDILAEARVTPTQAPAGVPRSFQFDASQHEAVDLPNAALYGHTVVETDVPGEFVHVRTGELYNADGQRLGRCIVVHHAAPAAAAA